MSNQLRVSLIQSCLQWRDPESNREHLEVMLRAAEPSDLYVLPETFTTGFLGETRASDEGMDGETVQWLRSIAGELGGAVAGSAVIDSAEGRRNRFLFARPDGSVDFYDKKHLFSFAGEDKRYVAGKDRVTLDFSGWRICPQICYDLRFPAWCRLQASDYDALLFVANWPSTRVDAWDCLLRARAIENQCYVIAVNRVGEDGRGMKYPGHSAIYGPLGEVLIAPRGEEHTLNACIDLETVREIRSQFPFAEEADSFSFD